LAKRKCGDFGEMNNNNLSWKSQFPFFIGSQALVWQLLFFYIPLAFILLSSFTAYYNFFPFLKWLYFSVIFRSLGLALSTALLCLLIAYPLAYFIAFRGKKYVYLWLFFLIVPFWTNFLLHIFAWFFVLERQGFLNNILLSIGLIHEPIHFLNSMFAVYLMMVYYYLPFMVLPIYSMLEKFDIRLIEASLDLGATWSQTIYHVILPVSLPGMLLGIFLVFVPSFGEFAIPELMGGDKVMFVGSVISHYILDAQTMSFGAAFTIISGIFLIASALLLRSLVIFIMQRQR
jgi:spermidine/putrescine transport system permease protein